MVGPATVTHIADLDHHVLSNLWASVLLWLTISLRLLLSIIIEQKAIEFVVDAINASLFSMLLWLSLIATLLTTELVADLIHNFSGSLLLLFLLVFFTVLTLIVFVAILMLVLLSLSLKLFPEILLLLGS